jgi:hypothetical protein
MTARTHFWLRLVGLALIFGAESGPRLWNATPSMAHAPVATAAAIDGR